MGDLQGWALVLHQGSCIDTSMTKRGILNKWLFINMGEWLMAMTFRCWQNRLLVAGAFLSRDPMRACGNAARRWQQALQNQVHARSTASSLSTSSLPRTTPERQIARQDREERVSLAPGILSTTLLRLCTTTSSRCHQLVSRSRSRSRSRSMGASSSATRKDSDLRTLRSHSSTQDPKITDAQSKSQTALLL